MAKCVNVDLGFAELEKELDALGDISGAATQILQAAAQPLVDSLKRQCNKHRRTGKMADSIKAGKVSKFKNGGYYVSVSPTGKSKQYVDNSGVTRDRSKPVRNMELLAYIEYGTKKQTKTPVIEAAVRESKAKCEALLQQEYDKYVSRKGRGA